MESYRRARPNNLLNPDARNDGAPVSGTVRRFVQTQGTKSVLARELFLKRVATFALLLALCLGLVLAFETPLRRLGTLLRLWSEELEPPLLVPVEGVHPSNLTDTWGATRRGGRSHEGIDIFASCGHPVVSSTEGIVLSVGENRLGGQVVWVLGPGGSRHYYAHLSGFAELHRGDHVQPGDTLAYVGNTGNAAGTPCHLHYGIYSSGGAQNPYPLLAQR
jgi:peptidoglycan LD-endopeptidase LytH